MRKLLLSSLLIRSFSTSMAAKEVATLGGGCFWCIEAVFQTVRGVEKIVSGYAGGSTINPTYEEVCKGNTGHAEVAQITYDTSILNYEKLLHMFMSAHDPTTLNRQGYDGKQGFL